MALIEKYPVNCEIFGFSDLRAVMDVCRIRCITRLFEDSANSVYILVSIYHPRGGCSQTHLKHLNIHSRHPVKGYWHATRTQSATHLDVLIIVAG